MVDNFTEFFLLWNPSSFYLMNVAVNCSCVEFPQKVIEIYFLAIFGNFTLERTWKVGRFLDIVAYFLNIWRSFVHGVSKCSQASSRFWLKYFANLAYLTVYYDYCLPVFVVFAGTVSVYEDQAGEWERWSNPERRCPPRLVSVFCRTSKQLRSSISAVAPLTSAASVCLISSLILSPDSLMFQAR